MRMRLSIVKMENVTMINLIGKHQGVTVALVMSVRGANYQDVKRIIRVMEALAHYKVNIHTTWVSC